MQQRTRQILIHALGSIGFLMLPILFSPDLISTVGFYRVPPFQKDFVSFVLLLLFFYLNYLVLLPRLFFKKKYFVFVMCIVISYLLISVLPNILINEEMGATHFKEHPLLTDAGFRPRPYPHYFFIRQFSHHFFQFSLVFLFSLFVKTSLRLKYMEKEKLNAELSYLKAQINPHFLFNTLNSIYFLALSKSDDTATAVVKLSAMMRYVLSESDHHMVSLEKEINYLSNYIELQKLRLENTVEVTFTVTGETEKKQIAPLILIPFVENAFKHGVNPEENSNIAIHISIDPQGVHFKVKNNKVNNLQNHNVPSGLGIENARTRLQLLYPAKHFLLIDDNENYFSVELNIDPL